jgi:hypothetical protein
VTVTLFPVAVMIVDDGVGLGAAVSQLTVSPAAGWPVDAVTATPVVMLVQAAKAGVPQTETIAATRAPKSGVHRLL